MRRDEVEEVYIANLREMRSLLESAIESLPAQLNPHDPLHARGVFSDWFTNTYLFTMWNMCSARKIPRDQWPGAALREDRPPRAKATRPEPEDPPPDV
jgi:hypothetical protein